MKYCPRCGAQLPEEHQFCHRCGLKQPNWREESAGFGAASSPQPEESRHPEEERETFHSSQTGTGSGFWAQGAAPSAGSGNRRRDGNLFDALGFGPRAPQGGGENPDGWIPGDPGRMGYWTERGFVPREPEEQPGGAGMPQPPYSPQSSGPYQGNVPEQREKTTAMGIWILAVVSLALSLFLPAFAITLAITAMIINYHSHHSEETTWAMMLSVAAIVAAVFSALFRWFW